MCLLALAIDRHPRFALVIASDRDEFHARPAAPLDWWATQQPGATPWLGGRDLASGGTWLGLTAAGRLAMLTNVRGVVPADPLAPSRGAIVTGWLASGAAPEPFWASTLRAGHNGFNLLAADFSDRGWFHGSNVDGRLRHLGPGLYGLSNAGLDSRWPKVEALKRRLGEALDATASVESLASELFAALADRSLADDTQLPSTGVPLERERQLSAAFIDVPELAYGTRCSTLIVTERSGRRRTPTTHVIERTFVAGVAVVPPRHAVLPDWPPKRWPAYTPVEGR